MNKDKRFNQTGHKVSQRHMRLIDEYFTNGFDQKKALLATGYGASTIATGAGMIFTRYEVRQEIKRRQMKITEDAGVTSEWIIARLKHLAGFDLPDIFEIHEDGTASVDMNKLTPDMWAAIGKYTVTTRMEGRGKDARPVRVVNVEPHASMDALKTLARIKGMFNDSLHLTDEADLIKRIQAGRDRAAMPDKGETDGE